MSDNSEKEIDEKVEALKSAILKPCPFCGNYTIATGKDYRCEDNGFLHIMNIRLFCTNCYVHFELSINHMGGKTEKEILVELVKKWQTREENPTPDIVDLTEPLVTLIEDVLKPNDLSTINSNYEL